MKLSFRKEHIPWLMATGRAALGPLVIAGQAARWSGTTLAVMIVTALLSDIFDGVLARRWQCDTPAVRLFDSMADTFFYLCVATALWFEPSSVLRTHEPLLLTLGIMEAVRFLFDFGKFGKPASYHSYLAKTWGLLLATAVILSFVSTHATPWMIAALLLGIVCNTQDLIMSILLPTWQRDIKTPLVAWRLHREEVQRLLSYRKVPIVAAIAALTLCLATTSHAQQATYKGGTIAGLSRGTPGTLDTTPADRLLLHFSGASTSDLAIPYKNITHAVYRDDVARHLGVLPAIVVGIFFSRQRRYDFSITFDDNAGVPQVAVIDVPRHTPHELAAILLARSPVCEAKRAACTLALP